MLWSNNKQAKTLIKMACLYVPCILFFYLFIYSFIYFTVNQLKYYISNIQILKGRLDTFREVRAIY